MDESSSYAKWMLFPAPVSAGSPCSESIASPASSPLCLTWAVLQLCTAGESFDAYLKSGHGGQMEYGFFS